MIYQFTHLAFLDNAFQKLAVEAKNAGTNWSLSDLIFSKITGPFLEVSIAIMNQNSEDEECDAEPVNTNNELQALIHFPESTHFLTPPTHEVLYLTFIMCQLDEILAQKLSQHPEDVSAAEVAQALADIFAEVHEGAKVGRWPSFITPEGTYNFTDSRTGAMLRIEFYSKTGMLDFLKESEYFKTRIFEGVSPQCSSCHGYGHWDTANFVDNVLIVQETVSGAPMLSQATYTCKSLRKERFLHTETVFPTGNLMVNDFFRYEKALDKATMAAWRAFSQTGRSLDELGNLVISTSEINTEGWGLEAVTNKYAPLDVCGEMGVYANIQLFKSVGVHTSFGGNSTGYVWKKGDIVIITHSGAKLASEGFKEIDSFDMRYWWTSVIDAQHLAIIQSKNEAMGHLDRNHITAWNQTIPESDMLSLDSVPNEGVTLQVAKGAYHVLNSMRQFGGKHYLSPEELSAFGDEAESISKVLRAAGEWMLAFIPKK